MSAKHTPTPWHRMGLSIMDQVNAEKQASGATWGVDCIAFVNRVSGGDKSQWHDEQAQANAEFIVEAVNAYEKLKTDNAKLQETISELQIQNSKGLYTPLHETERRKLKADNAALLEAGDRLKEIAETYAMQTYDRFGTTRKKIDEWETAKQGTQSESEARP